MSKTHKKIHRLLVITHGHVDITGWANIGTNMTTNAFTVVRIDITAGRFFVFLNTENGILRAIDNTVIAFETHTTTHTTSGFSDGLLFRKRNQSIFEMPQYFFR